MGKITESALELVGKTPLLRASRYAKNVGAEQADVLVKLEYLNPAGSVKDRIALAMIEDAEKNGILKPGATIIEPTSGNTGIGLAAVAAAKGYKAILTLPETMSVERRNLLKAYGAELVLTEGAKGMKGAIAKAEESISKVLAHINIALKQIKCERVIEEKDCLCKNWDTLTKADFQDLMSAGYTPENYQKLDFEQDSVFESLYFLNKKISVENMKKAAEELFQNPDCGHIFRIKGFLNTSYKEEVMMENKTTDEMEKADFWEEFNATRKNISIQPVKEGQEVLIMIGAGLKQEKIEECLERHCTEGFEK